MLHPLPGALQGAVMAILLIVNTVFWATPLYVVFLLKLLTPAKSGLRDALSRLASAIAQNWSQVNVRLSTLFQRIEWDIRVSGELDARRQYLV